MKKIQLLLISLLFVQCQAEDSDGLHGGEHFFVNWSNEEVAIVCSSREGEIIDSTVLKFGWTHEYIRCIKFIPIVRSGEVRFWFNDEHVVRWPADNIYLPFHPCNKSNWHIDGGVASIDYQYVIRPYHYEYAKWLNAQGLEYAGSEPEPWEPEEE